MEKQTKEEIEKKLTIKDEKIPAEELNRLISILFGPKL